MKKSVFYKKYRKLTFFEEKAVRLDGQLEACRSEWEKRRAEIVERAPADWEQECMRRSVSSNRSFFDVLTAGKQKPS